MLELNTTEHCYRSESEEELSEGLMDLQLVKQPQECFTCTYTHMLVSKFIQTSGIAVTSFLDRF
jgi:hypothetical protein